MCCAPCYPQLRWANDVQVLMVLIVQLRGEVGIDAGHTAQNL
jgi:hypothetical protein